MSLLPTPALATCAIPLKPPPPSQRLPPSLLLGNPVITRAYAHKHTHTHTHVRTHREGERERGEHFSRHGPLALMLSCDIHRLSRRNTTDEEQEYVLTSSPHHHSGIPLLVCIAMSSSLSPRLQHRHNNTLIVQ